MAMELSGLFQYGTVILFRRILARGDGAYRRTKGSSYYCEESITDHGDDSSDVEVHIHGGINCRSRASIALTWLARERSKAFGSKARDAVWPSKFFSICRTCPQVKWEMTVESSLSSPRKNRGGVHWPKGFWELSGVCGTPRAIGTPDKIKTNNKVIYPIDPNLKSDIAFWKHSFSRTSVRAESDITKPGGDTQGFSPNR
ncbi:uncharacterized protein EI90DRAFT_2472039 [Cantharellus anzutake]|uniref:uncharacterized protein n=1 Tax=Cantharellus anzutake TaxID=1750568 RepID=UPI0019050777|nr:uncharacterized protein EI90DRAFT_2472039 [Cantharellus anzutake]KAF8339215.1 hypothetical protein EI90DRAFT_2472039 [Cantharellus anzutake]